MLIEGISSSGHERKPTFWIGGRDVIGRWKTPDPV